MKLSWEVDGVNVTVEKLENGIEAGMERAVDNILEILERDAKQTIRVNNRVFKKQVLNSFTDQTGEAKIESGLESRFLNTAKHAGAVEHGVHRSKYADGGPPIAALMPWVLANLQDWQLSDDEETTGGNTLKQSISEEVTQSVSNNIDWTNITYRDYYRLADEERDEIESTLKSSDLDDLSVDEMYNQVKAWKVSSDPYQSTADTERIVQYGSDVKETFEIDGDVRGTDVYTPEPTYDETKEALRTLHETSKIYAYNHLDDGDGSFIAGRWAGRTEISRLGKQIWEDPLNSEWNLDSNIVNNYSTNSDSLQTIFGKGLRHNKQVDIEEDLIFTLDHTVETRNNREAEVHIRAGKDFKFKPDDIDLTAVDGTERIAQEVLNDDFDAANFSNLTDDELIVLANLIKHMANKDVTVDTQAARDRLNSWLDEFLARDVWERTDTADYKWERYVDSITS